ncbi:Pyridoxal reductase chloroplastic [Zea mays]|uniref:Pyridoxal reductase chloroplastic n=1 Tax=Zea mays TaxID=4577 RepID=A0A1D6F9C3_MAIZE|nr:Pyridoxal reductase chloroplastic [Zea mays]
MITALQVSGGGLPLLFARRRRRAFRPPQAVASDAAAAAEGTAREDGGKVALGGSGVAVTKLGVGAWSWGDTTYWNEFRWDDTKLKAAKGAFDASIDCGITFFDTAEVYGAGVRIRAWKLDDALRPYLTTTRHKVNLTLLPNVFCRHQVSGAINSESLLGRFIKERQRKEQVDVAVATKFAALPWRFGRGSVICALKASLDRLGVSSVELYQLHWPGIWGNEDYLDGLGDAVEQGLVKAVGVSNYSEKRLRDAYERLRKRGVPLASNQVNYSLIYRNPEENGVKAACDELGVTLIAYSPIAQGALTGKYTPESPPKGPRGRIYTPEFLTKLQPLINRIKEIGGSYGRTSTQVVLNWLVCQGNVVPIPGAKNAEQAREFAGALGWSLAPDEVEELRSMARQVKPVIGFPVEKL